MKMTLKTQIKNKQNPTIKSPTRSVFQSTEFFPDLRQNETYRQKN